jgi:hypothetical protein
MITYLNNELAVDYEGKVTWFSDPAALQKIASSALDNALILLQIESELGFPASTIMQLAKEKFERNSKLYDTPEH